jgi:hypothetical protein
MSCNRLNCANYNNHSIKLWSNLSQIEVGGMVWLVGTMFSSLIELCNENFRLETSIGTNEWGYKRGVGWWQNEWPSVNLKMYVTSG